VRVHLLPSGTGTRSERDWSNLWAPYDEVTYRAALAFLRPDQVVLDIGAGDLRFARRAARRVRRLVAVEQQRKIIESGLACGPLPPNLTVVVADARVWPFPPGVDVAVLLMRHCADYGIYVRKLRAVGCQYLITNARWRMGVERVPLACAAVYESERVGWYACVRCGGCGFVPGDPSRLTPEVERTIVNVEGCPACTAADNVDKGGELPQSGRCS
jgi:hypothetical protein